MQNQLFVNFSNIEDPRIQELIGTGIIGLILGFLAIVILIFLAIYIYESIAWMKIGKNQKYKYPWLAWIPFARASMKLQMGKYHWAWVFLILIPIAGWIALIVLLSISIWRIFEKANYEKWLALSYPLTYVPILSWIAGIAYLIIIGFIAWKKK